MHFGYNTGFDGRGRFSLSDGSGFGKNITEFGAEMSPSVHVENRKKTYILILCKGQTQ